LPAERARMLADVEVKLLDLELALFGLLESLAALVSPGGGVEGLARLREWAEGVKSNRAAAAAVLSAASESRPIDEARLARGLADAQAGKFEDTAAIVERLKAGGDL
jgi:hypothetical protein